MRDRETVAKLERVYNLLARSFLRYVVEAAGPSLLEPWDRKAQDALKAWDDSLLESLGGIEEVLTAEKAHPLPHAWPVDFSQYNYLRASYLLQVVIRKMGPEIALVEAEAAGLSGWPEAALAVERALSGARSRLAGLQALEAERPKDPPAPGVKRGVSASRW